MTMETHLGHCNQGEYVGACKYGDADCPAMTSKVARETLASAAAMKIRPGIAGDSEYWRIRSIVSEAIAEHAVAEAPSLSLTARDALTKAAEAFRAESQWLVATARSEHFRLLAEQMEAALSTLVGAKTYEMGDAVDRQCLTPESYYEVSQESARVLVVRLKFPFDIDDWAQGNSAIQNTPEGVDPLCDADRLRRYEERDAERKRIVELIHNSMEPVGADCYRVLSEVDQRIGSDRVSYGVRHARWRRTRQGERPTSRTLTPTNPGGTHEDEDLGNIARGHVCKHGGRWPHACQPCDDAVWEAHSNPGINPPSNPEKLSVVERVTDALAVAAGTPGFGSDMGVWSELASTVLEAASEILSLQERLDKLELALTNLLDTCGARGRYHALRYADAVEAAEALALSPQTREGEDAAAPK